MEWRSDRNMRGMLWNNCSDYKLYSGCVVWGDATKRSGVVYVLLFYAIATVFQLHHGGDMMYEMRRRKPVPTVLLTQGIFNLPHHMDMV